MRLLILFKSLLVFFFLAAGVIVLMSGLNIEIPLVKFKGLEAHQIPVGIAIILAGVALAYFWKVSEETIESTSSTSDGSGTTYTKTTKTTYKGFKEPF